MTRFEDRTPGARVRGLIPERTVEVVHLTWHGTEAATLTYRDGDGRVGEQLLDRDDEARPERCARRM